MSIHTVWDDPDHRILRQIFPQHWTLDEYRHLVERTNKLLMGLDHTVHIIVDGRESERAPSNILSIARYVDSRIAPNQGTVVVLGADDFVRTVIEAAKRIAPRATADVYLVDTLEEAHAVLAMNAVAEQGHNPR
ncbi:MAG: hypothetical protein ACOCZH_00090 [Phototrophicaceae bacterium]